MNAARLEKSKRLNSEYQLLRRRLKRGATTAQLQAVSGSMAVHSDIAEIRDNMKKRMGKEFSGQDITCRCESRKPVTVFRYHLVLA